VVGGCVTVCARDGGDRKRAATRSVELNTAA